MKKHDLASPHGKNAYSTKSITLTFPDKGSYQDYYRYAKEQLQKLIDAGWDIHIVIDEHLKNQH